MVERPEKPVPPHSLQPCGCWITGSPSPSTDGAVRRSSPPVVAGRARARNAGKASEQGVERQRP